MQNLLLISVFGFIGVLCRYGIDQQIVSGNNGFPASTLLVNIMGSFLAGCVYAISSHRDLSLTLQSALLVGFCGGFTTFSAYALQTLILLERGKLSSALAFVILSPSVGLLAAYTPVWVAKKLFL